MLAAAFKMNRRAAAPHWPDWPDASRGQWHAMPKPKLVKTDVVAISADIHHIFVYGTLKRGQCRERCWPCAAVSVRPAVVRGALYDLGAYPASVDGADLVRGELWEMRPQDVGRALEVLDEVEGYAQRPDDLFVRRLVRCDLDNGRSVAAWSYFYAQPERLTATQRIATAGDGTVAWPREP
jgi:gamma-glutamylcyclotransferase (GGCT)/AIG2-like uncharacterized protein YtfP